MRQWAGLRQTYLDLGHDVRTIEPVAGLPDMVFAANGGTVIGGTVLGARFRYPQRAREADAYLDWFRDSGYPDVRVPDHVNEGEGDILFTGRTVLAGYGFRSDQAAAAELGQVFGWPVVSLRLVDPRFYHLDTALCVLDADTAMYYPAAFDDAARAAIAGQFTELIEAKDEDAEVLGLNAVSDGRHVVLPVQARGLAAQLSERGFTRSESTCPNCSRAAADPSAARWSCAGSKWREHTMTETMTSFLELTSEYGAHNYHPLPIVAAEAEGAWVTDVEGRRYLDMLAAYSALNFGHRHPRLIAAAHRQLEHLTLVSRAFDHDQFGPFCAELAELADMDVVLPMNTGAEAVESAIKVARKWGYTVKGVPADQAVIIVFSGNFHGRTTTIISFSTDEDSRADFGPYTPGFRIVPYGDLDALTAAVGELGERVVAVLVEPIQGEAGVVVPPAGFLTGIRELCTAHGILMIADEIQSGLGRTGFTFACAAENVVPDAYLLGKALGGGIVPVSAMVSTWPVLGVLQPGQHGSTFAGNPLGLRRGPGGHRDAAHR